MKRIYSTFPVTDTANFKDKMLDWSNHFNISCFLDNNGYDFSYSTQECLLAAGAFSRFKPSEDFFISLTSFCDDNNDWIFGHFNYDLKNKIENLESGHKNLVSFPDSFLFVPSIIIQLKAHSVIIGTIDDDPLKIYNQVISTEVVTSAFTKLQITQRVGKEEYIAIIERLKEHIKVGDCYEINFCQEFYSEGTSINPLSVYRKLNQISPNPFSCFYKVADNFVLCESPERYLKKSGDTLISQPVKGTAKRDMSDSKSDLNNKIELAESMKDKSENVMIVDLVRNDLSKVCVEGSVSVENLFEIQSLPFVHQMVSTVIGKVKSGFTFSDILYATFPMGSMTGAPKLKVMELIEKYETTKRGIYSGTIGYITPGKDFDFNVVIRSILYNSDSKYVSYQVGGGITYNSDPEKEYEECLLKASAIKQVL